MNEVIAKFGIAVDTLPDGDFVASGSLRRTGGVTSVENFATSIAGADLRASGILGLLPSLAGTNLAITVEGEDLSRLLPPGISREALNLALAASGNISISESELSFEQFRGNIEHTTMAGDFVIGRDSFLGNGNFDIQVDSPDVYHLFLKLEESDVPQTAKLKYRGRSNWEDNFWGVEHSNLQIGMGELKIVKALDGLRHFKKLTSRGMDFTEYSSSQRHCRTGIT